jgi:hypothetical protein
MATIKYGIFQEIFYGTVRKKLNRSLIYGKDLKNIWILHVMYETRPQCFICILFILRISLKCVSEIFNSKKSSIKTKKAH